MPLGLVKPRHLLSRLVLIIASAIPGYLLLTDPNRWSRTGVFKSLRNFQPIPVSLLGLLALIAGLLICIPQAKARLVGYSLGAVFYGIVAMTLTFSLIAGIALISPLAFGVPAIVMAFAQSIKRVIDDEHYAPTLQELKD